MYHVLVVRPVIVILRSILTAACLVGGAIAAEPVPADPVQFDIGRQPLRDALVEFAQQSDRELLFSTDVVEDKEADYVVGTYEPEDALEMLLAGTGLEYSVTANDTILVAEEDGGPDPGNSRTKPILMAQNQASVERNQASRRTEADSDNKRPLEEIIVTGTHIRGIAPESSPTRTFNREDIRMSGAATAQDFLDSLPENFGGGAKEFGSAPGNTQAGSNTALGSGVNLRGLGSGSTLVLVNGRRVAPSSDIGGFVDISMIPASAIERVEIMTDGASSIYGADAVAGVVNFVLRDDYDGVETSLRYGTVTEGDMDEYRTSLTAGKDWGTANGLIVYEYYKRGNLDSSDREFSKDALSPNDLLPRQERHSFIGTVTQRATDNVEFGADILYSKREALDTNTDRSGPNQGTLLEFDTNSDNLNIGANLSWNFAADWYLDVAGVYSEVSTEYARVESGIVDVTVDDNADLWSLEGKATGTVFELPGGEVKLAVGGHVRQETFIDSSTSEGVTRDGDRDVYAVFGEAFIPIVGPENALPGVRRLEINVSGRYEDYSDFGSKANPKLGLLWAPTDSLKLRGTYSTSFKPPTVGQTGALDRGALAAPTSFLFSVFGVTPADPSISDVVILYTFGTAENLNAETSRAFSGGFDYDVSSGRHDASLSATYFDIDFEDRIGTTPVPAGQSNLIAFNAAFTSPGLFPEGTFAFFPTTDEVTSVLAGLELPPTRFLGADPMSASIIDNVTISRNLSRTTLRGVDFAAKYSFDAEVGLWTLGIDGTYLIDFTQQATVTTPVVQLLDTQFNPLNLNFRGRAGYARDGFDANLFVNYSDDYKVDSTENAARIDSWTTVDVSFSYDTGERVETMLGNTLLRLSIQNIFNEDPPAALSLPGIGFFGYDPTNASPIGRFLSFAVTKRF